MLDEWMNEWMNEALGHISALYSYTESGATWANEMKFDINHSLGTGLISRLVDPMSSAVSMQRMQPKNVEGIWG